MQGGDIETYTSHFIATQAISRVMSIIFWLFTYAELNSSDSDKNTSLIPQYTGEWFMLSQVIHFLIMADFMYYWVKSVVRGGTVQLPTYQN